MGSAPAWPKSLLLRVAGLPDQPGVYLFKDAQGQVLYVGKAFSLRRRVASYFHAAQKLPPRQRHLVERILDVEIQQTSSEAEALLLEATLIKEHHPKYNVAYRDDKSYPLLKLTKEPFPRLMMTREKRGSAARYFGPFPDAGLLYQALQFLRRVFPLRTCRTFPKTPCLEYHLGQCLAPCVGYIDEAAYRRIVQDLEAFLEGRRDQVLRELARRMRKASGDQRFEDAARLRDQITALTSIIVAKEKSALAGPLEQLHVAFKLPVVPRRIEAFDISNLYGTLAVGSMVTFIDGRPAKADYRRFRIKTVEQIDDYQMMREILRRRYSGTLASELPWPDLILIDGGRGQLNVALAEFSTLGRSVPMLGLAKRFEHIIVPHRRDPVVLLPTSPVLHLLQHIRDEAHRFAVSYHRRLRQPLTRASALDEIPLIGPKRKALLLSHFGSTLRLRRASPQAIAQVAHISLRQAEQLLQHLATYTNGGST